MAEDMEWVTTRELLIRFNNWCWEVSGPADDPSDIEMVVDAFMEEFEITESIIDVALRTLQEVMEDPTVAPSQRNAAAELAMRYFMVGGE